MPGSVFYPMEGCLQNATERKTVYANSVLHLFKSEFVPTPSSTLDDFNDNEADFTGYATKTLTAWFDPILAPGSGYMIESPLVQWSTGATNPAVGNIIGGVYMLDSAGKLRMVAVFEQPMPMELANQGIPLNLIDFFPNGA